MCAYVCVSVCEGVVVVVVGGRTRSRVRMNAGSEYPDSLSESTLDVGRVLQTPGQSVCVCVCVCV